MKRAFLYIFFSSETYSINLSSGRNVIHTRHSIDQSQEGVQINVCPEAKV